MSLRTMLDALPEDAWSNDRVSFRKLQTQDDLIYAGFDCKLKDEQVDFVNPAWFSIGRAYLAPENNYPCIIYSSSGERIGFINLSKWLAAGDALSWSYYIDRDWQGMGYGRKAAQLAIEILQRVSGGGMIKVSTEVANEKAQRLYLSLGMRRLDELDGDDLVFGIQYSWRNMRIDFGSIVLRDMIEPDIEDYVRWFTTETKWSDFDAPWEPIEDTGPESQRAAWREYYAYVKDIPDDVRRPKFEIECNGRHLGWVSAYLIDENYAWVGKPQDGQTLHRAIGIDLCESDIWGQGIGTGALRAFMDYCYGWGDSELYIQTWSGNARMLRCAEKLGFRECGRNIGNREAGGQRYDGLTLKVQNPNFRGKSPE